MNIKKLVLILSAPFMLSSFLVAQQDSKEKQNPERDPAKRQEMVVDNLSKELSLTPDQELKVKALMEERNAEIKTEREAQKQKMEAQRRERSEQMQLAKERQKKYDAKMKEILSSEQYIRYLEIKSEKKEEFQNNRKDQRDQNRQKRPGLKKQN